MSWLNQALRSLQTQNKTFDYRFPGLSFEAATTVRVADLWRVDGVGPAIDLLSRFGNFRRSYSTRGQVIEIQTVFEAPAASIDIDEVDSFNRFLDIVIEEGLFHVNGVQP
jgi:hypothetical protein